MLAYPVLNQIPPPLCGRWPDERQRWFGRFFLNFATMVANAESMPHGLTEGRFRRDTKRANAASMIPSGPLIRVNRPAKMERTKSLAMIERQQHALFGPPYN